jgi:hypothetical protein
MKKQFSFLYFLVLLVGSSSVNGQSTKSEFHKTVDSINAIIKANPWVYYMKNKQYDAFIKKISATKQGILSFTDSIPKLEIDTIKNYDKTAVRRPVLIPDCCPRKNSRKLDLFAVKKWDIHYPYADLIGKNNEIYGRFIGLKKPYLEKLKEQFDKLTTLCKKKTSTK